MKAYVYHGPDQKGAWEEVPNPTILGPRTLSPVSTPPPFAVLTAS